MKGLIPACQELADSMGKAFNEVLYGTESDSDKKYINMGRIEQQSKEERDDG